MDRYEAEVAVVSIDEPRISDAIQASMIFFFLIFAQYLIYKICDSSDNCFQLCEPF